MQQVMSHCTALLETCHVNAQNFGVNASERQFHFSSSHLGAVLPISTLQPLGQHLSGAVEVATQGTGKITAVSPTWCHTTISLPFLAVLSNISHKENKCS